MGYIVGPLNVINVHWVVDYEELALSVGALKVNGGIVVQWMIDCDWLWRVNIACVGGLSSLREILVFTECVGCEWFNIEWWTVKG